MNGNMILKSEQKYKRGLRKTAQITYPLQERKSLMKSVILRGAEEETLLE